MSHIQSRFVYERSLQRDVAHVLGNVRAHVPQEHYFTVDRIIRELVDLFHDVDPIFDVEDFCTRARAHRDLPDSRWAAATDNPLHTQGEQL